MRCVRQVNFLWLVVVVSTIANLPTASAQMIGNRTLGAPALSLQQQRSGTPFCGGTWFDGGSGYGFARGKRSLHAGQSLSLRILLVQTGPT